MKYPLKNNNIIKEDLDKVIAHLSTKALILTKRQLC